MSDESTVGVCHEPTEAVADHQDVEWVRESVIDDVRSGETDIARSGAWLAERSPKGDKIRVYRVQDVVQDE